MKNSPCRSHLFLLLLSIFIPLPGAADFSLFFTPKEQAHFQRKEGLPIKKKIALSAIIYLDDAHWSIWINGRVLHPETTHFAGFFIEKVTAEDVTFSYLPSKESPRQILTLSPK